MLQGAPKDFFDDPEKKNELIGKIDGLIPFNDETHRYLVNSLKHSRNPISFFDCLNNSVETWGYVGLADDIYENSLVDLWCLFDFIQENLLRSLSEFNKNFRRPIEKDADEDGSIINELRQLIEPQVLRRMKHDVAELPKKTEVADFKNINISPLQRKL